MRGAPGRSVRRGGRSGERADLAPARRGRAARRRARSGPPAGAVRLRAAGNTVQRGRKRAEREEAAARRRRPGRTGRRARARAAPVSASRAEPARRRSRRLRRSRTKGARLPRPPCRDPTGTPAGRGEGTRRRPAGRRSHRLEGSAGRRSWASVLRPNAPLVTARRDARRPDQASPVLRSGAPGLGSLVGWAAAFGPPLDTPTSAGRRTRSPIANPSCTTCTTVLLGRSALGISNIA